MFVELPHCARETPVQHYLLWERGQRFLLYLRRKAARGCWRAGGSAEPRSQRDLSGSPAPPAPGGLCPQRPRAARGRTPLCLARLRPGAALGPHSGLVLTCQGRAHRPGTGNRTAPDFTGPRRVQQVQGTLLSTVGTCVPKYSRVKEIPCPPIWKPLCHPLWHPLSWDKGPFTAARPTLTVRRGFPVGSIPGFPQQSFRRPDP